MSFAKWCGVAALLGMAWAEAEDMARDMLIQCMHT